MVNKIKELLKLIQENPDLPVKFMVASDEVEDHLYTEQKINLIEKSIWCQIDDQTFTHWNDIFNHYDDGDTTKDEIIGRVKQHIQEAIVVYLGE